MINGIKDYDKFEIKKTPYRNVHINYFFFYLEIIIIFMDEPLKPPSDDELMTRNDFKNIKEDLECIRFTSTYTCTACYIFVLMGICMV